MDKKLSVVIEIDTKTKQLKVLNEDFAVLTKKIHEVSASVKDFGAITKSIFTALAGYDAIKHGFLSIADAVRDAAKAGIDYNASIETMQIGIASLIAAQKRAAGENIRFYDAMKQSSGVMEMLKKANLETSATLTQLTQGFQAALAPAMQAGLTIKQTVEYTKLMTQAAGAMGVPMDQLAQELKSVVSGTIDLNSVVATNLGITNEQIKLHKEQGDLFEYLKEKLSAFAVAGQEVQNSFMGVVSNLEDSWSELLGLLSKPAFEELKEGLKELNGVVKEWIETVRVAQIEEKKWFETKNIEEVKIKAQAIGREIEELRRKLKEDDGFLFFGLSDAEKSAIEARIKKLNQELYLLGKHTDEVVKNTEALQENGKAKGESAKKSQEQLKELQKLREEFERQFGLISDDPYEKLLYRYDEYIKRYGKLTGAKKRIDEWYYKELEKLNKETLDRFEDEERRRLEVKHQAYLEYLKATGQEFEYWALKEGERLRELFEAGLDGEQILKVYQADYKKFLETQEKRTKEATKETTEYIETEFDQATKNIYQSFEDNFFDLITGKFHDFKDFLRSFFDSILQGIINPFAKSLSASIAGGLGAFVGLPQMSVSSVAQNLGLKLVDGLYKGQVNGTEVVIDASGNVIQGASALPSDALSALSLAKSGISLATNPSALLYAPSAYMGQLAGYAYGLSPTLGYFTAGASNWLVGGGYASAAQFGEGVTAFNLGTAATGAVVGGAGGYLLGSLGDKLFGADTYAAEVGVAGGTLGGIIGAGTAVGGPIGAAIGAVLGSLVGGIFGKKKITTTGIELEDIAGYDHIVAQAYADWKKKSWFSSSSGTQYEPLKQIVIDYMNNLFRQFDYIIYTVFESNRKLLLTAGRIPKGKLEEIFVKGFLFNVLDLGNVLNSEKLNQVLDAWKSYAGSLKEKITDVVLKTFSDVLKTKRDFEVWLARFKGNELSALKIRADQAKKDLEWLKESLGATNVTIDNYMQLMDAAIKASPDPNTINNWVKLSEALRKAAEAEQEYRNTLERKITDNIDRYKKALSLIEPPKSITNITELIDAIKKATPESVSYVLDAINSLKSQEIEAIKKTYNLRIEQLNNEKRTLQNLSRYLDQLRKGADKLRAIALTGTVYAKTKYFEFLDKVRYKLNNRENASNDIESLIEYATSYQEYLKASSSTEQEYLFKTNKIANTLENLADEYNIKTQTEKIENAITTAQILLNASLTRINATYQNYTNLLKETIEQQYKNYAAMTYTLYGMYLGYDSPIIKELRKISGSLLQNNAYTGFNPAFNWMWKQVGYYFVKPFAEGGIVTSPTVGLVGEAGYPEAIIPLKNPNDPLAMNELKAEIRALRKEVALLRVISEKYQPEIAKNTQILRTDARWSV